ncbi:hypothetical protein HNV11_19420 [Spirosoma taeanense]|uniref:Uncharacterized protein n=1 Tax=Spirosoma taeanense TaxID=2735870 RepID=A0A6M5YDL8_9BACT|nr:patatin-like phospholipase family protein [Spirosoma taeanense]QJW91393.1 hypothetical protein HNV11_19420 [Spirosoma taeanense]
MLSALPQNSPESSSDSHLSLRMEQFAKRWYRYRVPLLLLSILVASVLLFLESPFGEYHIHALSQKLAFSHQSPFLTIQSWSASQQQLAQLEILIDNGFILIYGLTLFTWCVFFALHSLFVVGADGSELHTPTARFMKRMGLIIALLVLVGMTADFIENIIMNTWFYSQEDSGTSGLPWLWTILIILKFFPVVAAVWYILLHPLGILYSFIELGPGQKEAYAIKQNSIQTYAQTQQHYMAEVKQATLLKTANPNLSQRLNDRGKPPGDPKKRRFHWLLAFWSSLLGVQFLIYLLIFMGIIINLDQFDEIFFLWLSTKGNLQIAGTVLFLLLTLVGLGAMLYVTSKILLYLKPIKGIAPPTQSVSISANTLTNHFSDYRFVQLLPLVFVALPFVITGWAFVSSYRDLPAIERDTPLYILRFVLLIIALILTGLVTVYRFWRSHRPNEETEMLLFTSTTPTRDYALLVRLIPGSMIFGQALLNILLLVFIPSVGLTVAQLIGLHAVLLLWLCAVAYLGTLLIQFNKLPLYPLILIVVLYALIVSMFNDNSAIRQTPDTAAIVSSRPTFENYFDRWYRDRTKKLTDTSEIPVVIIAAEGGGIRAAAWTAACLYQLDSLIPDFSRYVFGISGVSGGSVGAATYIALQRANAARVHNLSLIGAQSRDIVSHDLIAPTVASMLFRGGVHNLSPAPVYALDRNRWLEDAWEKALFDHIPDEREAVRLTLEKSFLTYYDSPADSTRFPLLFLNSSVAETGQKALLSPLNLGNPPLSPTNKQASNSHFYDVVDLFAVTRADIPFKTATFLSARFPFVTSGGRVDGQLPNMKSVCFPAFHLIDGGYVENTGIMTAIQLIRRLQQLSQRDTTRYRVRYYLLSLHNGQATDNAAAKLTFRFLSEPLTGFLSAAGRQGFALDQLVAYTLKKHSDPLNDQPNDLQFTYINFSLDRTRGHQYPLGWYLSPTAADSLNATAARQLCCLLNTPQMKSLEAYIARKSGTAQTPLNRSCSCN